MSIEAPNQETKADRTGMLMSPIPKERQSAVRYLTFALPPYKDGVSSDNITIERKSKAALLMQLFLSAYSERREVLLSEVENIYNSNPKNRTIISRKKIRQISLGAIYGLNSKIKKNTHWTIFSPDLKQNKYSTENPSFKLMPQDQTLAQEKQNVPQEKVITLPDGQQYNPHGNAKLYLEKLMQGDCSIEDLISLTNAPKDSYEIRSAIATMNGALKRKGWILDITLQIVDGKVVHFVHMRKL